MTLFSAVCNLPKTTRPQGLSTANYIQKILTTADTRGMEVELYDKGLKQCRWMILPELEELVSHEIHARPSPWSTARHRSDILHLR